MTVNALHASKLTSFKPCPSHPLLYPAGRSEHKSSCSVQIKKQSVVRVIVYIGLQPAVEAGRAATCDLLTQSVCARDEGTSSSCVIFSISCSCFIPTALPANHTSTASLWGVAMPGGVTLERLAASQMPLALFACTAAQPLHTRVVAALRQQDLLKAAIPSQNLQKQ